MDVGRGRVLDGAVDNHKMKTSCLLLFSGYTLLVPGWTPFAFKTAFILCGIASNKALETFLTDFGPY